MRGRLGEIMAKSWVIIPSDDKFIKKYSAIAKYFFVNIDRSLLLFWDWKSSTCQVANNINQFAISRNNYFGIILQCFTYCF